MDTSSIIIAVVVLMVTALIVSAVIQRREEIIAAKKQKASQFVYRAKNSQELLDKIRDLQVNPEIIQFIHAQIVKNYKIAASIFPNIKNIQNEINRAEMHLKGFKPSPSNSPEKITDEVQINVHISKLKKLYSYLKKHNSSSVLNDQQFKIWGEQITSDSYQFEIDGLLKLALRAANNDMPGTAKNHIENIQKKLNSYELAPEYKTQRQLDLKNLKMQLDEFSAESKPQPDEDQNNPLDDKTKW